MFLRLEPREVVTGWLCTEYNLSDTEARDVKAILLQLTDDALKGLFTLLLKPGDEFEKEGQDVDDSLRSVWTELRPKLLFSSQNRRSSLAGREPSAALRI